MQVSIINATLYYGFEYLGNSDSALAYFGGSSGVCLEEGIMMIHFVKVCLSRGNFCHFATGKCNSGLVITPLTDRCYRTCACPVLPSSASSMPHHQCLHLLDLRLHLAIGQLMARDIFGGVESTDFFQISMQAHGCIPSLLWWWPRRSCWNWQN